MGENDQLVPYGESVPATQEELLTAQFYNWEKCGRGWQLWNYAVEPEPPFQPFIGHYVLPGPVLDDARKPTLLGSLVEKLRERLQGASRTSERPACLPEAELAPPEPLAFDAPAELIELQVSLPAEIKISRETAEQFLLSLTYCEYPLAFELIGTPSSITLQFVSSRNDHLQLRQQLTSFFPEVSGGEKSLLKSLWSKSGQKRAALVDFGLSNEFMRPLRVYERLDSDPLVSVAGALSHLGEGELGLLQVLFQRARYPWAESVLRAVTDWAGEAFFADAPEIVSLAQEKVSRPLFACVIRAAAQSADGGRAWEIVKYLGGALAQFSRPLSNELIPLTNDGYPEEDHKADLLLRETRRSGMLLSSAELVSLVHLPTVPLRIPKLKREEKKTRRVPTIATGHRLVLGANVHLGNAAEASLSPEHRLRHTYVIGASGTGKSTLLLNMIIQDIQNGEGIGVLDPHGDLIDEVLGHVPEARLKDVVLLDPSDEAYPVGFNILSAHSELEKNLLGSDLVAIFRRFSTSWGDQMGSVLANAILAFLESERGGTLIDLRRFLVEEEFRNPFLATVRDPEVVYYWQKEFPLLKGKPQSPILTRLDTFLRPKLIRYMVAQRENRLDFGKIMNERKIFLAKLAQGAIGEANAYLLGALLVAKFHQLAMGRQQVPTAERAPFYLYIDEFQNFVTPSMAAVLSGARKYHLGLILAHQELRQLWNKDTEVASAVIANPATRICFRLGDFDAKKLAQGFSFFDAEDLQNLGVGEAICRVERAEYDFNLKTLPLTKVEKETTRARRERLIALSRERYGRRREEVEAELLSELPRTATHPPKEELWERAKSMPSPLASPPVATRREERPRPTQPDGVSRPVAPAKRGAPARVPREPVLPGRGGPEHKYLQQLVKRLAEDRGYRAIIEKPILGGAGSVDVSLEMGESKIACEISVTSTDRQEFGNIGKCLAAGYEKVILLASDTKALKRVKESVSPELDAEALERVLFLLPDEFVSYLESEEAGAAALEETVRGYKVKVQYKAVEEPEKKARKQAISQVIFGALRHLRKESK